MKAVFLDRATFSSDLELKPPNGLSDYQVYEQTPNDAQTIIERCQHADIIITNKVKLTAEVIAQCRAGIGEGAKRGGRQFCRVGRT